VTLLLPHSGSAANRLRPVRLLGLTIVASVAGLVACGENGSEQQSVVPPTTTITMEDNRFDPQGQEVKVGMKLTWVNKDDASHDVDFVSGAAFESDPVAKDGTIEYTPRAAGKIAYVCSIHPSMTGTLVVE
jgi:plastocyanin